MAKLTLTIDSEEFDYLVRDLGIDVNITEPVIMNLIKEKLDVPKLIETEIKRLFIEEGKIYDSGQHRPYRQLSREVRELINAEMKPIIDTAVGNYIRTQDHTVHKLMDEEIKKHIELGIKAGIEAYAQKMAKKISDSLVKDI